MKTQPLNPPNSCHSNGPAHTSSTLGSSFALAASLLLAVLTTCVAQPVITVQPVGQSVSLGANVTFSSSASGTPPLSYQWRLNDEDLPGKTSTILTLLNIQLTNAGNYTLVVTNLAGADTSHVAVLDVDPTFTKILNDPIVADTGYSWHAQAWGDYDGDDDPDVLIITDRAGWDPIYRNNGDGTFTRLFEPTLQAALESRQNLRTRPGSLARRCWPIGI